MLVIVLTAVLADPRYVYLPPVDPPHCALPISIDLHQPRTRPPRTFSAAQARAFHGLARFHGFDRVTVTVRYARGRIGVCRPD